MVVDQNYVPQIGGLMLKMTHCVGSVDGTWRIHDWSRYLQGFLQLSRRRNGRARYRTAIYGSPLRVSGYAAFWIIQN